MDVSKELLTMDTYNVMPYNIMVILDNKARTIWPTMQRWVITSIAGTLGIY